MKNISAKNVLLTLAQAPVVWMLWVIVHIELSLTKLLGYLANPLLSPKSQAILKRIVDSKPTDIGEEEYYKTEDILFVFDKRNERQLN